MKPTFLCLASYFKGSRFLEQAKAEGCNVYLLTVEKLLNEAWPRHALNDIFAVPSFAQRRDLIHAVTYLMRSHKFDRIVALDDFDVEVAGLLREHIRLPGHGESAARYFRDKLAMRTRAAELGVLQPAFTGIFHHADVTEFLARTPGPWLVKPRGEASAAGIRRCQSTEQIWQRIHELGDEQSFHLIEQMIPGDLYHVDSLVAQNQVVFAEVNAYWKPLLDVYQGGGIYATRTCERSKPEINDLKQANEQILTGFGLGWGASHTEFMRAHQDGKIYFIETSCRVGGAETATMVEAATGVNLWGEWAKLEIARTQGSYTLPPTHQKYAGVTISLANQEYPDTSSFHEAEIIHRLQMKNHIGFVFASESSARIEALLETTIQRIARDFHAVLPPADSVAN